MRIFLGVLSLICGLTGAWFIFRIPLRPPDITVLQVPAYSLETSIVIAKGVVLLLASIVLAIYARIAQASIYQEKNQRELG